MPYEWTTAPSAPEQQLRLWPHQSLSARGFATFVMATFLMILIPVFSLLGTRVLWVLLPFALMAVAGIYFALQRNHKVLQVEEVLTVGPDNVHVTHTTHKGEVKEWQDNRHWVRVTKYKNEGPVPNYITLGAHGREVEIGAFLSEDERIALYDDLVRCIGAAGVSSAYP